MKNNKKVFKIVLAIEKRSNKVYNNKFKIL